MFYNILLKLLTTTESVTPVGLNNIDSGEYPKPHILRYTCLVLVSPSDNPGVCRYSVAC